MTQKIITVLMLVVAVIHIVPITGFFGTAKLESLYGVTVAGREMEILMRHRAVLFGILGGFFAYAAFNPAFQPAAFVMAGVTIASFFYLAFSIGGYNAAIQKIVVGDFVAALSLMVAVVLYYSGGASGDV